MKVPRLSDNSYDRCLCGEERLYARVAADFYGRPVRSAECRQFCMSEPQFPRLAEELGVPWIGSRPATLYIVYPEVIEFFGDPQFILNGK